MTVIRSFGYAAEQERKDEIDSHGVSPELLLTLMKAAYPTYNPYAPSFTELQWQGNQGACQGHALAMAFQVALVQKYSRQAVFSRAAGYYLAQEFDGINSDLGSTLNAGQKVANSGICLENEWPYPARYNNRKPSSAVGKLNITMPGSKVIRDADLAWELLKAGAMIQTGVAWTSAFEHEISDRYTANRNAGGHSTLLYGLAEGTDNAIHHNSWKNWMGDGRSQWTKNFFNQILRNDRWAVFVAYDSSNLQVPGDIFERLKP